MPLPSAAQYPGSRSGGADYEYYPSDPAARAAADEVVRQYARVVDAISMIARAGREYVEFAEIEDRILRTVEVLGIESVANLPPFPLPGSLGSLRLADLSPALAAARGLSEYLSTPQAALGGISPDTAIRRIAETVPIGGGR
jgi:hypothetical protein